MFFDYTFGSGLLGWVISVASLLFWLWMIIDAARKREWIWLVFMIIFSLLTSVLYFFMVYLPQRGSGPRTGFELPGAADRRRIAQLKSEIHHLDKAHSYLELGDIYFNQGRLDDAEKAYRDSLERDGDDIDTLAHLGQVLLRQGKPKEAQPLLEKVMRKDGQHDYGHSMMAYAETLAALGNTRDARAYYEDLTARHTYARARVGFAQLLADAGENDRARKILKELIDDEPYMVPFQKRKERPWLNKAHALLRKLPG